MHHLTAAITGLQAHYKKHCLLGKASNNWQSGRRKRLDFIFESLKAATVLATVYPARRGVRAVDGKRVCLVLFQCRSHRACFVHVSVDAIKKTSVHVLPLIILAVVLHIDKRCTDCRVVCVHQLDTNPGARLFRVFPIHFHHHIIQFGVTLCQYDVGMGITFVLPLANTAPNARCDHTARRIDWGLERHAAPLTRHLSIGKREQFRSSGW